MIGVSQTGKNKKLSIGVLLAWKQGLDVCSTSAYSSKPWLPEKVRPRYWKTVLFQNKFISAFYFYLLSGFQFVVFRSMTIISWHGKNMWAQTEKNPRNVIYCHPSLHCELSLILRVMLHDVSLFGSMLTVKKNDYEYTNGVLGSFFVTAWENYNIYHNSQKVLRRNDFSSLFPSLHALMCWVICVDEDLCRSQTIACLRPQCHDESTSVCQADMF